MAMGSSHHQRALCLTTFPGGRPADLRKQIPQQGPRPRAIVISAVAHLGTFRCVNPAAAAGDGGAAGLRQRMGVMMAQRNKRSTSSSSRSAASSGTGAEVSGDGPDNNNSKISSNSTLIIGLALAIGLVASVTLPLPGWAKALPELIVGILFRAQIWRLCSPVRARVSAACHKALAKFNANRRAALIIPFVAAFVGWLTNWLAVQMIFYPIGYWGLPIKRWVEGCIYGCDIMQPMGIIGWQGIVPAKAAQMAYSMVDMVTSQLINVGEVFNRLDPSAIATLLRPEMPQLALDAGQGLVPSLYLTMANTHVPALPGYLQSLGTTLQDEYVKGLVEALQRNVDTVVDLKELVVKEMNADKNIIVRLFQMCGKEELKFLVDSGIYFGFLLGIIQMAIWLFYDSPWTLTAGGTVVGYLTNWIALKCIFEPLYPVQFGPFTLHGIFLKRQYEVSCEFANFLSSEVLTSTKMWGNILFGGKSGEFKELVRDHTASFVQQAQPNASVEGAEELFNEVADRAVRELPHHLEPLHGYIDKTLDLRPEMEAKLKLMSPEQFERVLHPIFEEDEMTLILAGAVLGAMAGYIQQIFAEKDEKERKARQAEKERNDYAAAAEGLPETAQRPTASSVTLDGAVTSTEGDGSRPGVEEAGPCSQDSDDEPPKGIVNGPEGDGATARKAGEESGSGAREPPKDRQ